MPSSTNTLVPDGVTPTTPYTLQDDLASQNPGLGASLIGVSPNGCFTSTNVQDALEEICAGGGGGGPTTADQVSITDAGGYFTSNNVEGALQEVGADLQNLDAALNNLTASEVAVVDAGGYYTATDVEGVLQELGASTASWNAKADNTITISGINGLQGGGDLTANRTLEPVYGTTANTVTQGNDSRLSDARSPTGGASGDLGGTYPNPTVEKWQGKTLGLTTPFVGQSPVWNGTAWVPGNVPAGGSGGGGVTYFLKDGTVADPPIVGLPYPLITFQLGIDAAVGATSATTAIAQSPAWTTVAAFVTDAGNPNLTAIPAGLWDLNLWLAGTATANTSFFRIKVYTYEDPAAPVLLATSDPTAINEPAVTARYTAVATIPQTPILTTTRVYVEIEAQANLAGQSVTLYYGGSTPTYVNTSIPGISGTGIVHVINGVVQAVASPVNFGGGASEITGVLPVGNGGTDLATTPTNGQLLIGNGLNYTLAELTEGSGIDIISGVGSITVANTGVLSVGGSAPISSSGGQTPSISITQASAVSDGYLSLTDWTTFNNKVPPTRTINGYALSADIALTKTDIGLGNVEDTALSTWTGNTFITSVGTLTTGVWNATTIAPAHGGTGLTSYTLGDTLYASGPSTLAKLAGNTTTTRQFLRQTGTGLISAAPVWDTVTKTDVGLGNVENTALSTWAGSTNLVTLGTVTTGVWQGSSISTVYTDAKIKTVTGTTDRIVIGGTATDPTIDISGSYIGQASITTLGTITTGVWNGTTIPILYGGTGQTTKTAAFDALSPMTTLGDIIYGGVGGTGTRLAGNSTTTRQFLREVGTGAAPTAPVWDTVTKTDVGLANVENTALSTWAGSANITTLGTIASGTVPAALTSIVDVGGYYTGTNVEAALQEVGLSLSTGAGGVQFNVASGVFQEATLGNSLFDVRYVNTGTGATPGANISSLAKGNGNNSTGLQVTADVTASGQTAKGVNVTAGSTNAGTLIFGVDISASSSGNAGTATGLRSVVSGTSSTNVGISTSVAVNTGATTNTGVSVAVSGVSTNIGESITVTGAATTNTGLTVSASGATTNYSALFTAGNVGVGTSTPAQLLTVQNGNLLLTNNNNVATELRLAEPSGSGANYTAFKATTQAVDITYTLPAALPAAQASGTSFGNAMLETTSAGVQTWRQNSLSVTANLNFGNTAAQTSADLTITVTGAAVGDCVSLGVDNAAVLANSCYTAWVSATDTVTVRFNNYSAASLNPANGTFKVIVTK